MYDPVQAFPLIWRPHWAHLGVLLNSAELEKNVYLHTCRGPLDYNDTTKFNSSIPLTFWLLIDIFVNN